MANCIKKIIFLCTGNTCRSPMAEVLAKDEAKKNSLELDISSRGIAVFSLLMPVLMPLKL